VVFTVAVAKTREWNGRKAGQELGLKLTSHLPREPTFVIVYATIQYEKYGGFQEFLQGLHEYIPKGTPLIGGTVAAFMTHEGVFSRGAAAVAVYSNEMDVAAGCGLNTRRNPILAGRECISQMKQKISESVYPNGFLFVYYSSAVVPSYPFIGRKAVITSKILGFLSKALYDFSLKFLQKGVDRSDEFLPLFADEFHDYQILAGGCTDDVKQTRNYVFFGNRVLENAVVGLALKTSLSGGVAATSGFKPTGKEFQLTKLGQDRRIIFEIGGEPAKKAFLKILGWPEAYLDDRVFSRLFWYPVSFQSRFGRNTMQVFGLFVEDSIIMPYRVEGDKLQLLTATGKSLLEAASENLNYFHDKKPLLGIISECGLRAITLGSRLHDQRETVSEIFGGTPFVSAFFAGEAIYSQVDGLSYGNDTFKSLLFWR